MTAMPGAACIKRTAVACALGALALPLLAFAAAVPVDSSGTTSIPALEVPSSALMSEDGNRARVEHILLKRSLKGRPTAELYEGLFGPGLERAQGAFQVVTRESSMAGVRVLIYEPRAGVTKANADRVLINLHGGGFVACFTQCGGMESIPIAALTGLRVISVDYRMAPAAHYPAATEDVVAVYREVLKHISPSRIGLFGCSAGGLLTAQSLARFSTLHLPMPAAAGIFCAGGDAAMGGDSRIVGNLLGDGESPEPTPTAASNLGYMTGASPKDSEAYPARDPAVLAKFPPTLIVTGTRDFAMSSAVNLHSKLVASGVDARLHVWEGGRHAFFYDVRVPEAREANGVIASFFKRRLQ